MELAVLIAKWRTDPRASTTILLCAALTECADGTRARPADFRVLVDELGRVLSGLHASDANVLIAAGRMLLASEELLEAQRLGLMAAKLAPEDPRPFRVLGEVMLRRGDAHRALRALERAVAGGVSDPQTAAWLERAKAYGIMQDASGAEAVARDLKWTLAALGGRPSSVPRSLAPAPARTPSERSPDTTPSPGTTGRPPARKNTILGVGAAASVAPGPGSAKRTLLGMPVVKSEPPAPSVRPDVQAPELAKASPIEPLAPRLAPAATEAAVDGPVAEPHPDAVRAERALPASGATAARKDDRAVRREPVVDEAPPSEPTPTPVSTPRDERAPVSGRRPRANAPVPPLPTAAAYVASPFVAGPPRWSRNRRWLFAGLLSLVVAEVAGAFVLVSQHRRAEDELRQANDLAAIADGVLHRGGPTAVAVADSSLTRARQLAPASRDVALVELRERVLSGLDADADALPLLDAALDRARAAKLGEAQTAFARLAAAVARSDRAASDALVAAGAGATDGWFELAAGAALDASGGAGAAKRYARAVELEPKLYVARVRLARALLLEGELAAGRAQVQVLAADLPQRAEANVLLALWRSKFGVEARLDSAAMDRASVGRLPRTLRSIAWLLLVPKVVEPTADAWRLAAAVDDADCPAMAVLAGQAALDVGDTVLAQEATARALAAAPSYGPAASLAARLALRAGRIVDAGAHLASLSPAVARDVRGLTAYEAVDLRALSAEIEAAPDASPVLAAARDRLRASRPFDRARLDALRRSGAPWSALVATDAALDAGELGFAREVVSAWGDVKGHPARALRAARLARQEGRSADARELLEAAGGGHAALLETALLDADSQQGRVRALAALDDRFEPERSFLLVYLRARQGGPDEGRALLAKLEQPANTAPLSVRILAGLAAAEIQDGEWVDAILKPLLRTWGRNLDVVRAGVTVGLLPRDALQKRRAK